MTVTYGVSSLLHLKLQKLAISEEHLELFEARSSRSDPGQPEHLKVVTASQGRGHHTEVVGSQLQVQAQLLQARGAAPAQLGQRLHHWEETQTTANYCH